MKARRVEALILLSIYLLLILIPSSSARRHHHQNSEVAEILTAGLIVSMLMKGGANSMVHHSLRHSSKTARYPPKTQGYPPMVRYPAPVMMGHPLVHARYPHPPMVMHVAVPYVVYHEQPQYVMDHQAVPRTPQLNNHKSHPLQGGMRTADLDAHIRALQAHENMLRTYLHHRHQGSLGNVFEQIINHDGTAVVHIPRAQMPPMELNQMSHAAHLEHIRSNQMLSGLIQLPGAMGPMPEALEQMRGAMEQIRAEMNHRPGALEQMRLNQMSGGPLGQMPSGLNQMSGVLEQMPKQMNGALEQMRLNQMHQQYLKQMPFNQMPGEPLQRMPSGLNQVAGAVEQMRLNQMHQATLEHLPTGPSLLDHLPTTLEHGMSAEGLEQMPRVLNREHQTSLEHMQMSTSLESMPLNRVSPESLDNLPSATLLYDSTDVDNENAENMLQHYLIPEIFQDLPTSGIGGPRLESSASEIRSRYLVPRALVKNLLRRIFRRNRRQQFHQALPF